MKGDPSWRKGGAPNVTLLSPPSCEMSLPICNADLWCHTSAAWMSCLPSRHAPLNERAATQTKTDLGWQQLGLLERAGLLCICPMGFRGSSGGDAKVQQCWRFWGTKKYYQCILKSLCDLSLLEDFCGMKPEVTSGFISLTHLHFPMWKMCPLRLEYHWLIHALC